MIKISFRTRACINKSEAGTIKTYYALTKPGIIYGNLVAAAAGFLFASRGHVRLSLLLAVLAGTSLVIASACVFNNYIDRDIDERMARTKNRALVKKLIPGINALAYASVLGLAGFIILALYTNAVTLTIGAIAFVVYVGFYTFAKRHSVHSTIIGSVAGSAPPVAGYCAVTNHFDGAAALLFLALSFWQMPHFYAISIYRLKDYKAAGLPVLSVKHGVRAAKLQIVIYILGFIAVISLFKLLGYTGYTFLLVILAVSLAWLRLAYKGFNTKNDQTWARSVFLFSLVVTLLFSFMLSVNTWLP